MQMLDFKIYILLFLNLDFSSCFTSFILSLSKQVLTLDADLWFTLSNHMFAFMFAFFVSACIRAVLIVSVVLQLMDVCFFFFVYVSQTLSATEQKYFLDLLRT